MTDSVVVEGYVRLRDGKKWKTRWVVLRKPSPVADCLVLLVYKDKSDKNREHKERASVTLEDICGLETGQWFEGVAFTLAVLCLSQAAVLGFDSRETLSAWEVRIRYSLGEVHRFNVGVLPGTKLEGGPATLHLCNNLLALARDIPPVIIGHWNLPDLRRYGPVPNGFVFEGGTRCGYWAGVFFLASAESEHISFLFDCIARGVSPTRGPFGLRPVLPDPSAAGEASLLAEEKVNQEAEDLERRLSKLSHRYSTASSMYTPSVAGDDRSISGSSDTSDTSQSDCSVGSRLTVWAEPVPGPGPSDGASSGGFKLAAQNAERVSVCQGGAHPVTKVPRRLQEIGRQPSSDSGIATGSHSSYSGSFSSYTGSLDGGPGDDYGSVFSLPPHVAADLSPCTCPPAQSPDYQAPSSLKHLYDTPRNVAQEAGAAAKDDGKPNPASDDADLSPHNDQTAGCEKGSVATTDCASAAAGSRAPPEQMHVPSAESRRIKVAPPGGDSCQMCSSFTSSKALFTLCSVCGGYKGAPDTLCSGPVILAVPALQHRNSSSLGTILPPEYHISNPADQVVEKWTGTPTGPTERDGMFSERQETTLPRKGSERLASLLADLLGNPSAGGQEPAARTNATSLYESMSPALGPELEPKPIHTQSYEKTVIYENCFKCKEEHCYPPQRIPPAKTYNRGSFSSTLDIAILERHVPSGPYLETGGMDSVKHQETPFNTHNSRRQPLDGEGPCKEMRGLSVTREEKRPDGREERRRVDPTYEIMESWALERSGEAAPFQKTAEEKYKYELMGGCGHQRFLPETEGVEFVFPPEACFLERSRESTYVNIPISPTSKKQLNYMELDIQEPGGASVRGVTAAHLPAQRKSSTKYAQIDITATETAHKVGTQHALGREEGLQTLELRRRGALQ